MPTYKLSVEVTPNYLPEQSSPQDNLYAFSYTILIHNSGSIASQLISRTWHINDAEGMHEKVKGLGVVGHQPLLAPGQKFQYSSWAQIGTPQGSMSGRLLCVTEAAEVFYTEVAEFMLADSSTLH